MTFTTKEKLLMAINDGYIDSASVISMCMKYMTEEDVEKMCDENDVFSFLDDDYDQSEDNEYNDDGYDDSMDGDFDSAMTSAGWGTDEDYGYYGE